MNDVKKLILIAETIRKKGKGKQRNDAFTPMTKIKKTMTYRRRLGHEVINQYIINHSMKLMQNFMFDGIDHERHNLAVLTCIRRILLQDIHQEKK